MLPSCIYPVITPHIPSLNNKLCEDLRPAFLISNSGCHLMGSSLTIIKLNSSSSTLKTPHLHPRSQSPLVMPLSPPLPATKNLGDLWWQPIPQAPYLNRLQITAFFHLHKFSHIHKFLWTQTVKILVHSFISWLDYCNSVLSGLPECDLHKLQCVQNTAVHLITCTKKHEHITPILMELPWLPVQQGIHFKILVLD